MISPVVVLVAEDKLNGKISVTLQQPLIGDGRPLDLDTWDGDPAFAQADAQPAPADAVRTVGELIYERLSRNDDVRKALESALEAAVADRRPLLLDLRLGTSMEALPWEAVRAPDGFLGLDARLSVGRQVRSAEGRSSGVFAAPLRIAAVLSCLDVSARSEWEELSAAVAASPIPVEVLLFAGEGELLDEIVADTPAWVRLEGIPQSATDLTETMRRHGAAGFVPHVLHFFCHGSLLDGAHLEIATRSDWDRANPRQSSLTLEPDEVLGLTAPTEQPWLVVLNCCQLAAPPGGAPPGGAATHSFARELVQRGGVPAVVGMRAAVDSADATSFGSKLYRGLFDALAAQGVDVAVQPDWSGLVGAARRRLAEAPGMPFAAAAAQRRQWTLPVLYVRDVPGTAAFTVTRTPAAEVGQVHPPLPPTELRVALLRELLAGLGPDAPASYRTELEDILAATIAVPAP